MSNAGIYLLIGSFGPMLLGIAVLVALQLISAPDERRTRDPMHAAISVGGWALIAVGVVGLSFFALAMTACLLLVAAVVVALFAARQHVTGQQRALLWVLAVTSERFMPLVPALHAFASEQRGWFGRRVWQLADRLESGTPLPHALALSWGLVPREVLPAIRVGYESGALGPALRQAVATRDLHEPIRNALVGRLLYLGVLTWVGLGAMVFVVLKIVPQFVKIFADFELPLPAMTELLIAASRWLADQWYLFMPLLLVFTLLMLYLVVRYTGWIPWNLPGTDWLVRRLDTARLLDGLAVAAGRRRPLIDVLAALAHAYPKAGIRRRLYRAVAEIEAGAHWCDALYRHGLMRRAELGVLRAAERAENLPWALREMADSNRRRLAYRLYAMVQLLYPPVILAYALVVAFFILGLFVPLIALIQSLT